MTAVRAMCNLALVGPLEVRLGKTDGIMGTGSQDLDVEAWPALSHSRAGGKARE